VTISRAARLCLILIVFCQSWPTAKAQVTRQDRDNLLNIVKELQTTIKDVSHFSTTVLATSGGFTISQCAQHIMSELQDAQADIFHTHDLTDLSLTMINSTDMQTVNVTLADELKFALQGLQETRQSINSQPGVCGTSPAIANYVRTSLSLLNEAERSLLTIQRRLGPR
jgi:hypothetical protein